MGPYAPLQLRIRPNPIEHDLTRGQSIYIYISVLDPGDVSDFGYPATLGLP